MGGPQNHIRLFGLHVFCIDRQKFLIGSGVDILTARQFHQTAHVGIFRGDNITARQSHKNQNFRFILSLVLLPIFLIKILKLLRQSLRLVFPAKNLSQLLNGTVHPLHTPKV